MIQTREMDRVVMTVGPLTCTKTESGARSEVEDLLLHLVGVQSCCSERWRTCNHPLWT